jgi:hypothetical protein
MMLSIDASFEELALLEVLLSLPPDETIEGYVMRTAKTEYVTTNFMLLHGELCDSLLPKIKRLRELKILMHKSNMEG